MKEYLPLAKQINLLFDTVLHPEGRPYTLHEVSSASGVSVSALSHMRTGRITNPQLSTVREIAHFFGVPLRYFETQTVEECYALLLPPAEPEERRPLHEISFRAMSLTPKAQRDILTIIKWVLAAEELRKQGIDLPQMPDLEDFEDDTDG